LKENFTKVATDIKKNDKLHILENFIESILS